MGRGLRADCGTSDDARMTQELLALMILAAAFVIGYSGFIWALYHQEPVSQCPPHHWERYGDEMHEIKCLNCGCKLVLDETWYWR